MTTNTPNYNLKKPGVDDYISIEDINGNMDIIDAALNAVSDNGALKRANVVDNVTSTAVDLPLSANQGRTLKTAIDGKVDTSDISHETNCAEENKVAGAKQLNASIEGTYAAAVEKNKQNRAEAEEITLLASAWTGTTAPFTHDLTIPDTYDFELSLPATATKEQIEACQNAQVVSSGNDNIIRAWGDKPTIDIPVVIRKWVR